MRLSGLLLTLPNSFHKPGLLLSWPGLQNPWNIQLCSVVFCQLDSEDPADSPLWHRRHCSICHCSLALQLLTAASQSLDSLAL